MKTPVTFTSAKLLWLENGLGEALNIASKGTFNVRVSRKRAYVLDGKTGITGAMTGTFHVTQSDSWLQVSDFIIDKDLNEL